MKDNIFKQELNKELFLIGTRQLIDDVYVWQTKIVNQKTKKELILLEDRKDNNATWKEFDLRGESPAMLYTISGAYLEDKDFYLIINKFGQMILYKYHFTTAETFVMENKVLQTYFTTPAYGEIISQALSFFNLNSQIKLLDYISDSLSGSIVYFFYLDQLNKLQIIRYKKDKPLWMIGSFNEEDIQISE